MTGPLPPGPLPPDVRSRVEVLLCDADDSLFPSEAPAFAASVEVVDRFLAAHGVDRQVTPAELHAIALGRNFRATAGLLADEHGFRPRELDDWVAEEAAVVTAHLRDTLRPDDAVRGPLARLGGRLGLAAVSSSALARLDGCFTATGLAELIPPGRRFSAEDSLATPVSKPDPAVYLHACAELGIEPAQGLAVEDSVSGATSAVRAGCPTVGNVTFVPADRQARRRTELADAGVLTVVGSWQELADLLQPAALTHPTG